MDKLQSIWTRGCTNTDDFWEVVHTLPSCRVLIVDSIADIFRHETTNIPQRSLQFFRLVQHLRRLIATQHIQTVLILNQVSANFNTSATEWTPALGLSWSHCVSVRYQVDKAANGCRSLTLAHSPNHAPHTLHFQVTQSGSVAL